MPNRDLLPNVERAMKTPRLDTEAETAPEANKKGIRLGLTRPGRDSQNSRPTDREQLMGQTTALPLSTTSRTHA